MSVEQLQDPSEKLQERHTEQFEAHRYHFVIPEMSQQHLKGPSWVDPRQCLKHPFDEIDIGPDGHLEGEAIGESDVLSDRLENIGIFGGHYGFGGETEVPELYEEGLKRLDLEDLGKGHTREGVIHLHRVIILLTLPNRPRTYHCTEKRGNRLTEK